MILKVIRLPNRTHRINRKIIEFKDGYAEIDEDDFTEKELELLKRTFTFDTPQDDLKAEFNKLLDGKLSDYNLEDLGLRESIPKSWTKARMFEYADEHNLEIPEDISLKADIKAFLEECGKLASKIEE